MRCHYAQFTEKNEVQLQPIIVFHGRHFVRHLVICNPICVKLLQRMSGVNTRNLEKSYCFISNRFPEVHKRGIHTHTDIHTHTHDDSIRRNAMRCISPKNYVCNGYSLIVILRVLRFVDGWFKDSENERCLKIESSNGMMSANTLWLFLD